MKGGRRALSKTLSPQPIDGDVRVSEGNSKGAKGRKDFKIETNKNKTSAMLKELDEPDEEMDLDFQNMMKKDGFI